MGYLLYENALIHYGTKGQRWGIRRFQNPDGTLTPEGKLRYRQDKNGQYIKRTRAERKAYKKQQKQLAAAAKAKKNKSPRDKDIKELTNKQLKKYIERMQLEKDAIDIRNQVRNLDPKPISNGEKFMNLMIDKVVIPAAQDAGKKFLNAIVDQAVGDGNSNNSNKNKNSNNRTLSDKQKKRAKELKQEGKSYDEIAKSFGVSVDTVKAYFG